MESVAAIRAPRTRQGGWWDRLLARALHARLAELPEGEILLQDGDTRVTLGQPAPDGLRAGLRVTDPRFYRSLALGGSVGAAEAYIQGWWTSDDLPALIRILARNRDTLERVEGGLARLARPFLKLFHWLHQNNRGGSRRNIAAHYDLGNEFFELFLDRRMMYSCALFEHPEQDLEDAAVAKLDHICRKLDLGPEDHLLEIGTGWGGMAVHAAQNYGCRVTTTTISKEQHRAAVQRVKDAGLEDRVEVLLQDYRDLEGQYDKLVSIEMIEAVGFRFFDDYFGACSRLLRPGGAMLLQAITINDQNFDEMRRSVDFIQRYVFPGSCLPSNTEMLRSITRVTDFRLFQLEDITPHYAHTLAEWRRRFWARVEEVRAQGFSEEFLRLWDFYLCYCEGGFAERVIGDVQLLLTKPRYRGPSLLADRKASAGVT